MNQEKSHERNEKAVTSGINMIENNGIPMTLNVKNELESNPHYMSTSPEDDQKWEEWG